MIRGTFPSRFDRCALVGSSKDLQNRSYGAEINRHDTVIRVNRIPLPSYYSDFGNRTDVFFTGGRADGKVLYSTKGQWYRLLGGKMRLCRFNATDCPFRSLVLKGSDFPETRTKWDDHYPLDKPGWEPQNSTFPLGRQSEAVNTLAYNLTRGTRPSNGLHAFITFSLICGSLRLYGFSGKSTADGHEIRSDIHNLAEEHKLIRLIMHGKQPFAGGLLQRLYGRRSRLTFAGS